MHCIREILTDTEKAISMFLNASITENFPEQKGQLIAGDINYIFCYIILLGEKK